MRRRFYGKKEKEQIIIYIIIGLMITAGVFTYISQSNTDKLPVYKESDKVETETNTKKEKELNIKMKEYTDDINNFYINIPEDWEKVIKNGYVTFIHNASGSSIQIQVGAYNPKINKANENDLSAEIAEKNKTFVSFCKNTTSSYELIYQDYQNNTYDYMEEVFWDREKEIRLVCTFNDKNYEKILPYYKKIIKSFNWKKEKPIPEDFEMYYDSTTEFEIGIPIAWTTSVVNNSLVSTDSESGATMSVSINQTESYLDTLSATDAASMLKNGKNNFIMKNYSNKKNYAEMDYSYMVNNVQILNKTYLFANGKYLYIISYDYEMGTIDEKIIKQSISLFKEYITNVNGDNLIK